MKSGNARIHMIYDPLGRRTAMNKSGSMMAGTETLSYGYNDRSEVTSAVSNTDENYNYAYAFDNIGNRLSAEEIAIKTEYTTNNLNQYLTETTLPASSNSTSLQTTQDASSPFVPAFDADGNQTLVRTSTGTWQVSYNGANRPILWTNIATGVKIHMIYDSRGRRAEKHVALDISGTANDNEYMSKALALRFGITITF